MMNNMKIDESPVSEEPLYTPNTPLLSDDTPNNTEVFEVSGKSAHEWAETNEATTPFNQPQLELLAKLERGLKLKKIDKWGRIQERTFLLKDRKFLSWGKSKILAFPIVELGDICLKKTMLRVTSFDTKLRLSFETKEKAEFWNELFVVLTTEAQRERAV